MIISTLFLVDNYTLTRISNKRELELDSNIKILGDFANAKDCLEALREQTPDIILMDIELPDINGIEVCKIIKQKYPKIKIIILTSYEDDSKILASLSCGACAYAIKGKSEIKKVINMVSKDGMWMDTELALRAFSKIPASNIENLENAYKYENIKETLTQREKEVLRHIIEGKTNAQIAREIVVSTNTIKAHVGSILEKLGAIDRVQAAVMAVKANLYQDEYVQKIF